MVAAFACLVLLFTILALSCYGSVYHSCDTFILSFLWAVLLEVVIIFPIQITVILTNTQWTEVLCRFFVWCCITFRMVEIFSLTAMAFDRALLLRANKWRFVGVGWTAKVIALLLWILAGIIGAAPIMGFSAITLFHNGACKFMSYELGRRFTLFVVVMEITTFLFCIICLSDVILTIKYLRRHLLLNGSGTRQTIPTITIETEVTQKKSLRDNLDLSKAFDNCRVILVVMVFCFLVNHLPYSVSIDFKYPIVL